MTAGGSDCTLMVWGERTALPALHKGKLRRRRKKKSATVLTGIRAHERRGRRKSKRRRRKKKKRKKAKADEMLQTLPPNPQDRDLVSDIQMPSESALEKWGASGTAGPWYLVPSRPLDPRFITTDARDLYSFSAAPILDKKSKKKGKSGSIDDDRAGAGSISALGQFSWVGWHDVYAYRPREHRWKIEARMAAKASIPFDVCEWIGYQASLVEAARLRIVKVC